jgi:hypothetical protein
MLQIVPSRRYRSHSSWKSDIFTDKQVQYVCKKREGKNMKYRGMLYARQHERRWSKVVEYGRIRLLGQVGPAKKQESLPSLPIVQVLS